MKKVVMKLDLHDDTHKQKALKAVSVLHGIESMGVDMKAQTMTVVGSADPIEVVHRLRKVWPAASIVSVGPATEEKKKEEKKDDKKQPELGKFMVYPPVWYPPPPSQPDVGKFIVYPPVWYPPPPAPPHYFVNSVEEDPNSCVIC